MLATNSFHNLAQNASRFVETHISIALLFNGVIFLASQEKYGSALALLDSIEKKRGQKGWTMQAAGLSLSYRGICIARMPHPRREDGLALCLKALETACFHAECYLNLGRVYLDLGRRREAHEAFVRGLALEPENTELRKEIARLGQRLAPLIPFLKRQHFLNRLFGRLRRRFAATLSRAATVAAMALMTSFTFGADYEILRLTDNVTADTSPAIHDGQVAWTNFDGKNYRTQLWNGTATSTPWTTTNPTYATRTYGGQIIWDENSKTGWDGIYWNGIIITKLVGSIQNNLPDVYNGEFVWQTTSKSLAAEIYVHKAGVSTRVTNNLTADTKPRISAAGVVWLANGAVSFWDRQATKSLSTGFQEDSPFIQGNEIVWQAWNGKAWQVYYSNGGAAQALTNSLLDGTSPQVHNGLVAWQGPNSLGVSQIFYRAVGQGDVVQLTSSATEQISPQVHDGYIAWQGKDTSGKWQIFVWDGASTTQLTSGAADHTTPKTHAGQIVWQEWDGGDWEVYLARSLPPMEFDADLQTIRWCPACSGTDLIRGYVSNLANGPTVTYLGAVTCLANNSVTGFYTDSTIPAVGETYFYLTRPAGNNYGVSSDGKLRAPDLGDCAL